MKLRNEILCVQKAIKNYDTNCIQNSKILVHISDIHGYSVYLEKQGVIFGWAPVCSLSIYTN
jgi:hypothetical protein